MKTRPDDTERYLRAATRGLWGRRRRDLRAELSGHITVRVQEFRLSGLSAAEAERQTLRELGAPGQVSRGMAGLHVLPGALWGSLAVTVLAAGLLSVWPQSQAQVRSIYGSPRPYLSAGYLNYAELQAEISRAGGRLVGPPQGALLEWPGLPRAPMPLSFPSTLTQGEQTYLRTDALLATLQNMGAPLRVSGWTNPALHVGQASLRLQTDDWRVINDLYVATLGGNGPLTAYGSLPLRPLEPNGNTSEVTLRGAPLRAEHVYALVTPQFSVWETRDLSGRRLDSGTLSLSVNVVQGGAGQADFRVFNDTRPFRLVGDVDTFQAGLDPYRQKTGRWTPEHSAPALLLELSGEFGLDAYRVVPLRASVGVP